MANTSDQRQQAHGEHEHHHGPYHIVVNGEEKVVHEMRLTFFEVCKIAFPNGPFGPNIVYTVTYTTQSGIERRMVEGDHVDLENGMVFNVGNTDKS